MACTAFLGIVLSNTRRAVEYGPSCMRGALMMHACKVVIYFFHVTHVKAQMWVARVPEWSRSLWDHDFRRLVGATLHGWRL